MNNHIITEPSRTIRALGRQTLDRNWGTAIAVVLLATAITSLPGYILDRLTDSPGLAFLLQFYTIAVTGPVNLGLAFYFLKLFRQRGAQINDLVSGFDFFAAAAILYIRVSLRIMLMTLLFIIPGIITSIRYSQVFFILADDPLKPAAECMYESAVMMEGNKAKYFWFRFSYVGWSFLAGLPQTLLIMYYMPDLVSYSDPQRLYNALYAVTSRPVVALVGLLTLLVTVYISAGEAAFYELANGNLYIQQSTQPTID